MPIGMRIPGLSGPAPKKRKAPTTKTPPPPIRPPKPSGQSVSRKPKPAPVRKSLPKPAPKAPSAPRRSASTASQGSTLGQNSFGSYSGIAPTGTAAGDVTGAPATKTEPDVQIPSEADFLAGDKIYNQEQASLLSALKALAARYGSFQGDKGAFSGKGTWTPGSEQQQYQQDFDRNLRDLGWDAETESWNPADQLTSYGSSFNNQLNDYAARGMLDSSAYSQALTDLNRGFDDQRNAMITGRNNFIDDLQSNWLDAWRQNQNAKEMARIEAINRRAAQYGLNAAES